MTAPARLVAYVLAAPAAPAQTTPSGWNDWARAARELQRQASRAIDSAINYAQPLPRRDGLTFLTIDLAACEPGIHLVQAGALPERVVLLLHGLDEPGSIWDNLAPLLVERAANAGFGVATFDYPNDQSVRASSDFFLAQLRALRVRGVRRVDIVGHSMGGLVARDALTRQHGYNGRGDGGDGLPSVDRLILVGTPLAGSPWARLRAVAELREQIERWASDKTLDPRLLLGALNDGDGQAGADLLPGSPFLTELNSRPWPAGVRITAIIGTIAPEKDPDLAWLKDSDLLRRMLGDDQMNRLVAGIDQVANSLGDGVVSVESATPHGLPEPADIVRVEGSHRGMLKEIAVERRARELADGSPPAQPAAVPIVLDRLGVGGSLPPPESAR